MGDPNLLLTICHNYAKGSALSVLNSVQDLYQEVFFLKTRLVILSFIQSSSKLGTETRIRQLLRLSTKEIKPGISDPSKC